MNSLAYVMYNRKLRERHMRRLGLTDEEDVPVNLDEYPSDGEWIAPDDDEASMNIASGSGSQVGEATQGSQGERRLDGRIYSRKRKATPVDPSGSQGYLFLNYFDI
jgi:hypothetical protein